MWLVGLAVFAAGLSTTLPLPLYVEYAGGGGTGRLAAAFACYAGILILTAPLLGPLPDRIGRRACVLIGLLLAGGSTLLLAFALMLVLEGLMPFIAPAAWRETFRRLVQLTDGQIRFIGLSSMLGGLLLLLLFL